MGLVLLLIDLNPYVDVDGVGKADPTAAPWTVWASGCRFGGSKRRSGSRA